MARLLAIMLPLALFSLAALARPRSGAAPPPAGEDLLPFRTVERTLSNGLQVIVVPTGFPNLVSLQIPVQAGARNEVEPGKSGFAHFFEHMMFRGTKTHPAADYQRILTLAGARQNAYTTDDYTNYHVTFAKEDLETILALEADRFQNLSYSEEDFRTEARAVLGEYNKNSANPVVKLFEVQRDRAFTTHTYKHTTMGFLKDIEDMPNQYGYSLEFFRRWYRPEHTTLIIAGDVTPEQVLPLVEKHWGRWAKGSHRAQVPVEPPPRGPVYAHVPWSTPTLPWVTVAFHGPAFSETERDFAALDLLLDLYFGPTSDLYRRLVEREQIVDLLSPVLRANADPGLATIAARLKRAGDAMTVRDAMVAACAEARTALVSAQRLAEAKSNARYGLLRQLDDTESIASTLAQFVRFRRSYATLNNLYRVYAALTPADLQAAAQKHLTDERLVVTTLAHEALPEGIDRPPRLVPAPPAAPQADPGGEPPLVLQRSSLPLLNLKLMFTTGSVDDAPGQEGLAALSGAMIADAGSRELRSDEVKKALFPLAASFTVQVDKELTTFTGVAPREKWSEFLAVALPLLLDPGLREEDFQRLKARQLNALTVDLRSNNEEELAKERLAARLFAGTPYGRPVLGTVAGLERVSLDDVRRFIETHYTRRRLSLGLAGDVPDELIAELRRALGRLPLGAPRPAPAPITGQRPAGLNVEIIEKDTRAVAISLGLPLSVTRAHPDFAALSIARAWLGEHRSSLSRLYQRIREIRGMNYGDYAYIEAFPGAGGLFFPPPNVARRAQLFEIWIRPVQPQHAHMALRIALHELQQLLEQGLSPADFESTRTYLMKNVFLQTATQDQQLGYALDSQWHGLPEYTSFMRERLARTTREEVLAAIRRHWSSRDLQVVMVAKDAAALQRQLLADVFSPMTYEAAKPESLLAEDQVIGALKLNLKPEAVRIIPVGEVFAR